ncbi:hypothetical protein B0H11DRAFT_1341649 [Mycena galericulata]|nr:hypothetical protein B0H11DRAFT_1341649 [Mycena galericulata]
MISLSSRMGFLIGNFLIRKVDLRLLLREWNQTIISETRRRFRSRCMAGAVAGAVAGPQCIWLSSSVIRRGFHTSDHFSMGKIYYISYMDVRRMHQIPILICCLPDIGPVRTSRFALGTYPSTRISLPAHLYLFPTQRTQLGISHILACTTLV